MGRRNFKKKKNKKLKIIIILIQIVLIFLIIYSAIQIYRWNHENVENSKILDEIYDVIIDESTDEPESKIDFNKLKQLNTDTVAWLKVNGTQIEYPVVKSKDNSYYLTHNFYNSYNKAGWIFADYKNKLDGTDKNIVIYGHNREDSSMFASLKNILTKDWYENEANLKINLSTEYENSIYQVFSVYKIKNEDYYITTQFTQESFNSYIDTMKKRSIKDFGIDVNPDDKILTLSTCDNNTKYRIVLHAKKVS